MPKMRGKPSREQGYGARSGPTEPDPEPTLTLSILKDVGLWENGKKNQATSRTTPAYSTTILTNDEGGEDFKDKDFNYRQQITDNRSIRCFNMIFILFTLQIFSQSYNFRDI